MIRIRASSINYYNDCPRRESASIFWKEVKEAGFAFRWLRKNVAAAVGSGSHKANEFILNQIIDNSARPRVEDGIENGIIAYRQEIEKGAIYDSLTPDNNAAEKQIAILHKSFFYEVLPNLIVENCDTEVPLEALLEKDVLITGTIDFVNPEEIDDWKNTKPSDCSAQLGLYSLLNKSQGYPEVKRLTNRFFERVKVGKPYPGAKIVRYNLFDAETAARNIIKRIVKDAREFMQTGDPWSFPCNPKSMLCSPAYCKCFGTEYCKSGIRKEI
jgi:hypothetical protein